MDPFLMDLRNLRTDSELTSERFLDCSGSGRNRPSSGCLLAKIARTAKPGGPERGPLGGKVP